MQTAFPAAVSRAEQVARLASQQFDVAIVGGGITGAGIALDAASRGLRVALVEKQDFAAGTSSRTTKLIHGGLRYMAQGQPGVTRDASIERRRLLQLAPHLVHSLPFVIPLTGLPDRLLMTAALTAYDLLASFKNVHNHHRLSRRDLYQWFPVLRGAHYGGGIVYYDGQTDDARLTITVLEEALRYGASAANHCEALGFAGDGHVDRLQCRDTLTGTEFTVAARRVVLASGVWVDSLLGRDQTAHRRLVRPAKGVHLILPRLPFGDKGALLLRHPRDGRYVFVVPWKGRTLVGTTDTTYTGNLEAPPVTPADVRYLLQVVNAAAPAMHAGEADILAVQAGLRPLINARAGAADGVSREDRITITSSGIVAIVGGKLTTYRHMAEKVMDRVVTLLQQDGALLSAPPCRTEEVPLGGFLRGEAGEPARQQVLRELRLHLARDVAEHLLTSYGAGAATIGASAVAQPELAARLVPDLPVIRAEVLYAVQRELAVTLSDVLTRRLGLTLLAPRATLEAAPAVAEQVGTLLGWDAAEQERQLAGFQEDAAAYTWG
ncbi:MAG TPA: glycerol-3-phosphate dehydrogenase/oxidase [Chloroflexota bacterium]|nr:glycerol-3-phosphate dehydrogenase/oxidase [Chloroflexota bacterium]